MMAVVGFILKVSGSNRATPLRDPIPGIAPTSKPMMAPNKAEAKFGRLVAV